ncbi:phage protein [Streptococcus pneumoniae]|uniref:Phage protein n=1 Tax=Streptococcus pneumoniae TaxID=1313 RepID=A0A4J1XD23_STREE|nr:phage protein [Streptococcus pneumoniae]VJK34717.1 phage protein [Streptococcus pneumoniae]VJM37643.1 phage protein [Streptococcus pneumoniae]VJT47811.1 phage protein [Streptococcus pneumoniae]VKD77838.1 phage protein [Streptococcus pneumoniae]
MGKQVFTQEILRNIQEENGIITVDLILDALPTWSEKAIKGRLSNWRYRKVIDYRVEDGEFSEIFLLRSKQEIKEEVSAGQRLKMDLYFRQVLSLTGIIESNTSKDNDKTKAIELQQKAMRAIPDDIYKELSEIYE